MLGILENQVLLLLLKINQIKEFLYNNGVLNITFDTKGASISSIKLTQHHDIDGNPVDLVFKGDSDKMHF